jgi:hypothetical protein
MKKLILAAILLLMGCGFPTEAKRLEAINASGYSEEIQANLRAKRVTLGMTADQVKLARGNPNRINRTVTANGVREQWVYGSRPSLYLYLTNGTVTGWQN